MPFLPKRVYDDLIAEVRRLRDLVLVISGHTQAVSHESNVRRAEAPKLPPPEITPRKTHTPIEEAFKERMGRYPDELEAAALNVEEMREPLLGGEEA